MRNFEEIYEKMNKETAQFVKDRYEFCLSKRKAFEEKAMLVSAMEEQRCMVLDSCKDELKCLSDSYDVLFCGVDAYRCDGFIEGEDEMEIVCMVVDEVKSSQFSSIILDECRILRGMSKGVWEIMSNNKEKYSNLFPEFYTQLRKNFDCIILKRNYINTMKTTHNGRYLMDTKLKNRRIKYHEENN